MLSTGRFALVTCALCLALFSGAQLRAAETNVLNPRGQIHIPIGVPNSVDTLKTFVEAEGNFSPGFGTYGVYLWAYDQNLHKFHAPTMPGAVVEHGLPPDGALIPWTEWKVGSVSVRSEVAQAPFVTPLGEHQVVAARVHFQNNDTIRRKLRFYVALRSIGAAGGPIASLRVSPARDALLANERTAILAETTPTGAGVVGDDSIGDVAMAGIVPQERAATSTNGWCSGALVYDIGLDPRERQTLSFILPVRAGRPAPGHLWDGSSPWAQFDLAKLEGPETKPEPDLELAGYAKIKSTEVFSRAQKIWSDLTTRFSLDLPDPVWEQGFRAMLGHVALNLNQGAPDVAVINYNVYNRDGVYIANILQKAGNYELAEKAIDYFLARPFNGRVYPEADNPGQILWIAGEHWRFTRDQQWLARVYPKLHQLARMIQYYRTMPGPHWVTLAGLEFGESIPPADRQELKPGRCDGFHPEYTEAFDIAGLFAAAELARALGESSEAEIWTGLAQHLHGKYDAQFGADLNKDYGSYCVLWPCRLYPLAEGKARRIFEPLGPQKPSGWRYFPLATAHQSLLAGNREAGHVTLDSHFAHPQMRGWFAFDEGGPSGAGGWNRARTTWPQGKDSVAMPHGWSIAEMHLLLRDALLFEDGASLILLGGIPPEWLTGSKPFGWSNLPTHFGPSTLRYTRRIGGGDFLLKLPRGLAVEHILRLPSLTGLKVFVKGKEIEPVNGSGYPIPADAERVRLDFAR